MNYLRENKVVKSIVNSSHTLKCIVLIIKVMEFVNKTVVWCLSAHLFFPEVCE